MLPAGAAVRASVCCRFYPEQNEHSMCCKLDTIVVISYAHFFIGTKFAWLLQNPILHVHQPHLCWASALLPSGRFCLARQLSGTTAETSVVSVKTREAIASQVPDMLCVLQD